MENTEKTQKKGFIRRNLERVVAPLALAGALALGGGRAYAQEPQSQLEQAKNEVIKELQLSQKEEQEKSSTEFILRQAIDDVAGSYMLTQQAQLNHKFGDATNSALRLFYERNTNDRTTFGSDFKNDDFRLNIGYINNALTGSETIRAFGTVYPSKDSFIGAGIEKITDLDARASVFAGKTFDRFTLEGTVDTEKNWAAVGRYDSKDYHVGGSVGQNALGELKGSASFNTDSVWIYAQWKPTLDVRLAFGDVDAQRTQIFTTVTDSGDNELIGDTSFPFTIGNFDLFKLYKTPLGKEPGDVAGSVQYREDLGDRVTGTLAYRVGDFGLKNLGVAGDVWYGLDRKDWGISVGFGGNITDNSSIRMRGQYDSENGWYAGLMWEVKF